VNFVLGEDYLKQIPKDIEYIFKTPGIRYDIPEILERTKNGAKLSSEMDLFFELCPAPIIAVTGSDGKTTTTTLISELLKKEGYSCHLGGNIGVPLVDKTDEMKENDKVVLELSSFQLHTIKKSPKIAVITNVTPNHLDWHTDLIEYETAKKNIFLNQDSDGITILNYDNEVTRNFAKETKNHIFFSRKNNLDNGICLIENNIVLKENGTIKETILDINKIKIPGMHNVENYMAAIAATLGMVSLETIEYVAKNFGGVPHRIEFVREIDGVKYYNDSIASTPARTTAGLISFENASIVLIAGGYDKKIPFDGYGKVLNERVKKIVLVGATSEKIEADILKSDNYNNLPIYKATAFEEAVCKAKEVAEEGDIVILSPACASFDLFKNFEERGNVFKDIVNNL
ncbi:MAG: UDP-N-acetylmuramoyl-L-alanine--D-glutamate ligase, partial [Clostridia bacterium]|nr:UDP-N-acetylmuramoyl-L-alanine--D-glutamate ligase [Clostridia bacterium]